MKICTTLSVLFLLVFGVEAQTIQDRVKMLFPDAEITPLEKKDHFESVFEIRIKQPHNHGNAAEGKFIQRLFLYHYDDKAPLIYVTEGYTAQDRTYELAKILKANQLTVEYRYNGASRPDNIPWQHLNSMQANEDLHRIKTAFDDIYKGKWLSTGISKGGTTAMIYRHAYPKDVCATVAYVAPFARAQEDKRTDEHILSVGSESCRKALHDFQMNALGMKDRLASMLVHYAKEKKHTFSIGECNAVEYAILEFTFSFWQWGGVCEEIPGLNAGSEEVFEYLNNIVGFSFYSDATAEYFEPAFYQFLTELGYYGFIQDPFKGELECVGHANNVIFGPKSVDLTYDGTLSQEVIPWIEDKAKKLMCIYGGLDTWTACGLFPGHKKSLRLVDEDGSHRTRISTLPPNQQQKVYDILGKWMKSETFPLNNP